MDFVVYGNDCFCAWEVKRSTSAHSVFDPLDAAEKSGFEMLDFSAKDALLLKDLPFHHRDPFDRMLIAQAISRKLIIATQDSIIDQYDCQILK